MVSNSGNIVSGPIRDTQRNENDFYKPEFLVTRVHTCSTICYSV